MSDDLDLAIRLFVSMTVRLPQYEEWLDAQNTLIWRDVIQDALDSGAQLSSSDEDLVAEADNRLIAARGLVLERFPQVFQHRVEASRRHWWWFLDEGPQVRDEAA